MRFTELKTASGLWLLYVKPDKSYAEIGRQTPTAHSYLTTSVYREKYEIWRLSDVIKARTLKVPLTHNYEIRYYHKYEKMPSDYLTMTNMENALSYVFRAIGYPRDNFKLEEYILEYGENKE